MIYFLLMMSLLAPGVLPTALAQAGQGPQGQGEEQLVLSVPLETDLGLSGVAKTEEIWFDLVKNAKTSIDLAQFYVSAEPKEVKAKEAPLRKILEEIENAGKRGVKIRLLLSEAMLKEDPATVEWFRRMKGATVRVIDLSQLTQGVHHAKYWIVDGRTVFVGSQNFDWRSLNQIHELGVRLEDKPLAKQLTRIFDLDWKMAQRKELPDFYTQAIHSEAAPPKPVELVSSPPSLTPPDTRGAIKALVELLEGAKKEIQIQLMDYSPISGSNLYWPEIDNALRSAALKGVKVRLLVSEKNGVAKTGDYLRSLAMIPGVEIRLASIPEWSGGAVPYGRLIRSKYLVVDDAILWVGNSNWTRGYFYNSRNIELVLRQTELAKQANQIFQKVWNSPYVAKLEAK